MTLATDLVWTALPIFVRNETDVAGTVVQAFLLAGQLPAGNWDGI